jgi:hypothetical protein
MKKKMRVATTFTGVAACAGFATPTAMAAPVPAGHVPLLNRAVPHRVRPDSTTLGGCGGRSTWFHVRSSYNEAITYCFGGEGTYTFSPLSRLSITSFCGGNNQGWIKGVLRETDTTYFTYFGHGTFYAHIPHTDKSSPMLLSQVHISKWSHSSKC